MLFRGRGEMELEESPADPKRRQERSREEKVAWLLQIPWVLRKINIDQHKTTDSHLFQLSASYYSLLAHSQSEKDFFPFQLSQNGDQDDAHEAWLNHHSLHL